MEWFFERLNTSPEPVFAHKDKELYKKDFTRLLKLGILKEKDICTELDCDLCDENHHATPFQNGDDFMIVCGSSSRKVSSDELKIWTVNQDTLLKLIQENLGITGNPVDETQGDKKLWKIGTKSTKHSTIAFYYLRQDSPLEFERLRNEVHDVHNNHNVIFTNTDIDAQPNVQNEQFVNLSSLIDTGTFLFSTKKLDAILIKRRRVQFDASSGNLFLDGTLVHAFGKGNERKYFIEKLWKDFEQPVTNADLYKFVRGKMGSSVADTAQKYCNKVKNAISRDYPNISNVLIQPHTNQYMLKDPDR